METEISNIEYEALIKKPGLTQKLKTWNFIVANCRSRLAPQGRGSLAMLHGIAALSVGSAFNQAIGIFFLPILTRLYTASEFGQFSIFFSVTQMLSQVLAARYEQTILLARNRIEGVNALILSFIVALSLTGFALIIFIAFSSQLDAALGTKFGIIWPLMAVTGLFGIVGQISTTQALKEQKNSIVAWNRILKVLSALGIQIAIAMYFALGVWGLIIGEILSVFASALFILTFLVRRMRLSIAAWFMQKRKVARIRSFAQTHADLPKINMPHIILNSLVALSLTSFVIGFFSSNDAGQLFMMQRIAALPASLIGLAVSQTLNVHAASEWRRHGRFDGLVIQAVLALSTLGLIVSLTLYFYGKSLFTVVLGPEWLKAGHLVEIYAPYLTVHLVLSALVPSATIAGRLKTMFKMSVVQHILFTGTFFIASFYSRSLDQALTFATAVSIPYMMIFVFWYYVISKGTSEQPRKSSRQC